MIWPGIVPYPVVHFRIRVASAFGSEFPYRPLFPMLVIEILDKGVSRITVCSLGIR